jgi:hypothetical protein
LPGALGNVGQAAATAGFPDADAIITNEESQLRTDCDGHFDLRRFAVPGGRGFTVPMPGCCPFPGPPAGSPGQAIRPGFL